MADYWKSQDRKYCDFCKCWIADNKPSVEFHEKGRRHQENVKKRLRNITRDSARDQKQSDRMDSTIKQMEAAAMAAYRKDVAQNADMTSQAINKKLQDDNLAIKDDKLWHEAKSKEGHTYYWNTVTNATAWEVPKEGYKTLKEQQEDLDKATMKQLKAVDKHRQTEALLRVQEQKKEEAEEKARLARERLKERRVVDDTPEPVYGPIIEPGRNDPYGSWKTVKESAPLDLQLPEQEEYLEVPVVYEPEPVMEFKEKTVESLEEVGAESSFKRRRIAKRNTRQRLDVD